MPTTELLQRVLSCPMANDYHGFSTVGEYFRELLVTLWEEGEGFSGKRPFGMSGWEYDVYVSLSKAGLISGMTFDEDGYAGEFSYEDQEKANKLIIQAIRSGVII